MALMSYSAFATNSKNGWSRMAPVGTGETAKTHYVNGKPNSVNGQPSRIYFSGKREWHKDGELHNENGPAVIHPPTKENPDGKNQFFLNGKEMTQKEHAAQVKSLNSEPKVG